MAYSFKETRGRKKSLYKIRNLEGITPRGFKFEKVEGKTAIYKRKKKNDNK